MAKKNPSECDDALLLAMLRDELEEDETRHLYEHVATCRFCQRRTVELAAEEQDWEDAADALSGQYPMPSVVEANQIASTLDPSEVTLSLAKQMLGPPSHPEMLGRLGRYGIERLVGVGGMGLVFKAYDSELARTVAIKMLAPYLASNASARKRFSREARSAAAVVHRHVVPIHNVETEQETPFLVMHYVAGESLQTRIDREGSLPLRATLRIGMQVASGLAAAHEQGLVHRDIKPANVLLEASGVE